MVSGEKSKKYKSMAKQNNKFDYFFYILLIVILILIIYPRAKPFFKGALTDDGAYFINDPDSCYHAKRIIYIARHNMKLPFYDPLVAHPYGDVPIWSPLYDWLCAAVPFVLATGKPSERFIINAARSSSVLFGIMGIALLSLLAYRMFKNKYISLIVAFISGSVKSLINISNAAIIDHNSFLFFLFNLSMYLTYIMLSGKYNYKLVIFASVCIASLLWSWPGSYVYVAVIAMVQVAYVLMTKDLRLIKGFTYVYLISGLAVSPLAFLNLKWGGRIVKFDYISFLTVFSLIGISMLFIIINSLFTLRGNRKKSYIYLFLAMAVLINILIYTLDELIAGINYAQANNNWLASIHESASVFYNKTAGISVFTFDNIIDNFSYLIFLFPIILILLIFRVIKLSMPSYCIFIVNGVMLSAYMIYQKRYCSDFVFIFVLVLALLFDFLVKAYRHRKAVVVLAITAMIIMLYPLRDAFLYIGYPELGLKYEVFKWLKDYAMPPIMGINAYDNKGLEGNGVIAPWQYGHHIKFYSSMPVVADNFGYIFLRHNPWEGFSDVAKFFMTENEMEAIGILKKYKSKYVMVSQPSAIETYPILLGLNPNDYVDYNITTINNKMAFVGKVKPIFVKTVGFRLSALYGSSNPYESKDIIADVDALKHFKLIYEEPGTEVQKQKASLIKIYEYVEGENLSLPASADMDYSLEGLIIIKEGYGFYYRQKGKISQGITVPYSIGRHVNNLPYAKYYKVTVNGITFNFER